MSQNLERATGGECPEIEGLCGPWGHVEKCLLSLHCRSYQCLCGPNPAGTQRASEPRDAVVKSLPVGWRRDGSGSGDGNREYLAQETFKSNDLRVWLILLFLWGHTHTHTHTHTEDTQMLRVFSAYTALPLDMLI